MRSVFESEVAQARGIGGRGPDILVQPPRWTDFARVCWPNKTALHLAAISGRDERTARRWLAGEFEPPLVVVNALIQKLFEPRA